MNGYKLVSRNIPVYDTESQAYEDIEQGQHEPYLLIDGDLYVKDWD